MEVWTLLIYVYEKRIKLDCLDDGENLRFIARFYKLSDACVNPTRMRLLIRACVYGRPWKIDVVRRCRMYRQC